MIDRIRAHSHTGIGVVEIVWLRMKVGEKFNSSLLSTYDGHTIHVRAKAQRSNNGDNWYM